jgi:hypothetical protein
MLLRRIRGEVRSVQLPVRCDSPEVRREMDLLIAARSAGRFIEFSAQLRSEEEREQFQPLLAPATPRGEDTLTMCGWCDRFLVDGDWVEVEDAVARLELLRRPELPAIEHGVCPSCSEMLMAA